MSDQPQAPEAGVALAADHQVIVDGDAERLGRRLDLARHLDVVAWRLGVPTGVIVRQCSSKHTILIAKEVLRHRQVGGVCNGDR